MKRAPRTAAALAALAICAVMLMAAMPMADAAATTSCVESDNPLHEVRRHGSTLLESGYQGPSNNLTTRVFPSQPDIDNTHFVTLLVNVYLTNGAPLNETFGFGTPAATVTYDLCHFEGSTIVREPIGMSPWPGHEEIYFQFDSLVDNIWYKHITIPYGHWVENVDVVMKKSEQSDSIHDCITIFSVPVANYRHWSWHTYLDPAWKTEPLKSSWQSDVHYPAMATSGPCSANLSWSAQLDYFEEIAGSVDDLRAMVYPWTYEMYLALSQYGRMIADVEASEDFADVEASDINGTVSGYKAAGIRAYQSALRLSADLGSATVYSYGALTMADIMERARDQADLYRAAQLYLAAYYYGATWSQWQDGWHDDVYGLSLELAAEADALVAGVSTQPDIGRYGGLMIAGIGALFAIIGLATRRYWLLIVGAGMILIPLIVMVGV